VRLGNAADQVIGRIFRSPQSPQDRPWFWTITARAPQKPTEQGYAATREEATAAFNLAWDPMPADDPEALPEWGKRNIQDG
jgi:hypothetical protein